MDEDEDEDGELISGEPNPGDKIQCRADGDWTPRPGFDPPGVRCADIVRLISGRWLCKVEVADRFSRRGGSIWRRSAAQVEAERDLPSGRWRRVCNAWETTYLFEDEAAALAFISVLGRKVLRFSRPPSAAAAREMTRDRRVVLRPDLFYGKFAFSVVVGVAPSQTASTVAAELRARLNDLIASESGEPPRFLVVRNTASVRVYLSVERDIALVRLAFGETVKRVERVFLFRGLSRDADGACADACPQGGDSPRS